MTLASSSPQQDARSQRRGETGGRKQPHACTHAAGSGARTAPDRGFAAAQWGGASRAAPLPAVTFHRRFAEESIPSRIRHTGCRIPSPRRRSAALGWVCNDWHQAHSRRGWRFAVARSDRGRTREPGASSDRGGRGSGSARLRETRITGPARHRTGVARHDRARTLSVAARRLPARPHRHPDAGDERIGDRPHPRLRMRCRRLPRQAVLRPRAALASDGDSAAQRTRTRNDKPDRVGVPASRCASPELGIGTRRRRPARSDAARVPIAVGVDARSGSRAVATPADPHGLGQRLGAGRARGRCTHQGDPAQTRRRRRLRRDRAWCRLSIRRV